MPKRLAKDLPPIFGEGSFTNLWWRTIHKSLVKDHFPSWNIGEGLVAALKHWWRVSFTKEIRSYTHAINRFRRVKYHRPPIGRCVHRQSFILHEKLIHLGNFDFEAENFEKEKKMLTTLGIFNIFKILKIRDDSFVALLILRHVIYDN